MKLSGKVLPKAYKANELLNKKVRIWMDNDYSSRYLLNIRELWLIETHKHYLIWGDKERQKQKLIQQSKRKDWTYRVDFDRKVDFMTKTIKEWRCNPVYTKKPRTLPRSEESRFAVNFSQVFYSQRHSRTTSPDSTRILTTFFAPLLRLQVKA